MDSYPGDLLAGVFPLVFAVDAILPSPSSLHSSLHEKSHKSNEDEEEKTKSSNAADDGDDDEDKVQIERKQSSTRSLFDRFLDVVAASLVDEEQSVQQSVRSSVGSRNGVDYTSDDEDEFSSYTDNTGTGKRRSFGRNSPMKAFQNKRRHTMSPNSTAFARVLSTETFFQRARILSISIRHGFPPSKDPEGTKNRTMLVSQARATMAQGATGANALRLKNIVENQPTPHGILPEGWLEKHVHALPSVLLVVTMCSSNNQEEQNKYFIETMEHLKESMAPKRECHIHVVCLVENEPSISVFTTDAWITMARHYTELPPTSITLLSTNDLKADIPTSIDFRVLIITIRDASLSYYLQQARRAKKKHAALGFEQQPKLLPLAARYCFKIGIFYEFQLNHEKSLKFFALGYRHTQLYYQFLLNGSPPDVVNPQEHDVAQVTEEESESDYETGIEVSLADASDEEEERKEEIAPMPPPSELKKVASSGEAPGDMTHQCRAVADWLNFKLLQAGFMATAFGERDGLLAASWQWRKHVQVMLRNEDHANPSWSYWSFVAHQRLVMSQLVERHPPSGEGVSEDVLIRCSPWRNYLAAAEAELRLDAELQKESRSNDASLADKLGGRSMRPKFVGGLDSDGLLPKLHGESKKNHTENALALIVRAIELFEQEADKNAKKDSEHEEEEKRPFLPSGARLYYMRGGILLRMQRYQDAVPHLKEAVRHCTKWDGLQDSIRQMLVACYDKCMPPQEEVTDFSDMLDTLFYSGLCLQDLRRVLDSYSSKRGNDALAWHVECQGESDTSPFSFSVTFPGVTHATAGDTVTASIAIKSNLKYAVHVKSVTLSNTSGQISVPSSDLAMAENADKGIEGGIIIHPETFVRVSTNFCLPRDIDKIAPGASGIGSDNDGKGLSAATARPRIAGVCAGAGARLLSEERFGFKEHGGQWSKSLLGGKVLRCDKMRLLFAPVYEEKLSADGGINFIEVSIEKKKPKTVAPPKRTPFEENNYVESAWSRPRYLPLSRGPCCLRVLGPMPQMIVTNLTDPMIKGKALEGTVNRLLFKLQAGDGEYCYDVNYKVSCSSMLLSSEEATTHLSPAKGEPPSTDSEVKVDTTGMRTPVLVSLDETSHAKRTTEFGYDLPLGWKLVGTGHGSDEMIPSVSSLKPGECTYICFELYRPPRSLKPLEYKYDGDGDVSTDNEESKVCQTDFDIEITYRQSRPALQKRMDPNRSGQQEEEKESGLSDSVVCEHSGTVVWESPISAEFFVDGKSHQAFPSGSRHPSNYVSSENLSSVDTDERFELSLIHGERTSMRCVFAPNVAHDGMGVEIARIGFEEKDGAIDKGDAACELRLTSTSQPGAPGVLYTPNRNDMSRRLVEGSKFGLTYTVEPRILDQYKKGSVTTRLGVLWVDWFPLSIALPDDLSVSQSGSDSNFGTLTSHGPLRMMEPATLKFRGPLCYIENAPFETVIESLPPSPKVCTPFEMSYRISNKTGMHQKLSIVMSNQSSDDGSRSPLSEGIIVSGLVHGDVHLGPFESQTLCYTALATKVGKTTMPALLISCDRYKTWVIKDEPERNRVVFVMP